MRTALLLPFALITGSVILAQPKAPAPTEPDYSKEIQRIAPLKPDEAIASFKVAPGFQLQLVAAEPMIASPVAMAFDEDARLFVVEMRDYSEHPEGNLGRVRLLEDTDGDGRMDKSTIFAEGLSWPTAIACSKGGVFVGAAPHIYWLKDTDGDGKADEKKLIYTGFSRGNVQGMLNTFLYGLDHRFHCSASSGGGTIRRPDDPSFKPTELRGRDFAFDPITLAIEPISGGAQHGASFDDYGRRFVCSNSDHLQMIMYEDRYAARAPKVPAPPARMSIAADGPQAEVFRISPVEPWRVLRTKLRVEGKVPGPIEGGGRAAGYFTSATGLTIYRGDAMPDQRGHAFVADVGSNIIHRKKLTPKGIGFVGTRIDEKSEFIASTDTWFRPVQMANGPDGCLWVADMYRETIEHPASIPPAIKKHVDLDSGRDRGRIYRITREGWKYKAPPKLSKATTAELVALLEHDNAWHRETASRLLHERQDAAAVQPLRAMVRAYGDPLGQLHAIYALQGMSKLTSEDVVAGLGAAEPDVVAHAIRLAEPFMKDIQMAAHVGDESDADDLRVRFQAALSLGAADPEARNSWIGAVFNEGVSDRYLRWATINSQGDVISVLASTMSQPGISPDAITALVAEIPTKELNAAFKVLPKTLDGGKELDSASALVLALVNRINQAGGDPEALFDAHAPQFSSSLKIMRNTGSALLRMKVPNDPALPQAMQLLTAGPPARSIKALEGLIQPTEQPEVQAAAAVALGRFPQPEVIPILIDKTAGAGSLTRDALLDALMAHAKRIEALVVALESGKIPIAALGGEHRARLRHNASKELKERVEKLIRVSNEREAIVDRYRSDMKELTGRVAKGKALFATHCSACHKLENVGHELGPNLAAFAQKGTDAILTNLLDPNREVNPQYLNYVVELKDGEIVSGVITSESASSVTVASGKGVERTVGRTEIATLRATGKSIMPEGLEAALDAQAVADLLAYLSSLKEAKK